MSELRKSRPVAVTGLVAQIIFCRSPSHPTGSFWQPAVTIIPLACGTSPRDGEHSLSPNRRKFLLCVFLLDGKTLAAGLGDGQVKLWDLSTAKEVSTLKGHVSHISRLAFFPDGQRLLNTVKIWNVATAQELISFKHTNQIAGVAVSPDGRIIASASNNVRLRFAVDPATSEESKTERLRRLVANTSGLFQPNRK